ncbi:hypothetical protein IF1G_11435 [Cordyceps javanica]|uniref:Uncharacterized protein n=1 Tax=Cordyceps javanica TaxID=43265 RepID=A0A545UKA4_9HYPO|nr:hypothetical protein IF1G_11435 [Cordyceps javanica]
MSRGCSFGSRRDPATRWISLCVLEDGATARSRSAATLLLLPSMQTSSIASPDKEPHNCFKSLLGRSVTCRANLSSSFTRRVQRVCSQGISFALLS